MMQSKTDDLVELLAQLGQQAGAIQFSRLYAFSDLTGQKLAAFCTAWDALPATQRQRLARSLVELAEASFRVSFDAIFRHFLSDPDALVRSAAIDGLWENQDVSLIGPFLTMLRSDPSAQVRAAAATGLGRYVLAGELEEVDPPVQARIMTELLTTVHLASESSEVRCRALESVAYACTDEVGDTLETAYEDDDENVRRSAVVGMGRSCDGRWEEIVLAEVESTSAAMRYEAVLACGGLALRKAVPALTRLLDDQDTQIRDASIWSLGQIGGEAAKQALLAAYEEADAETRGILEEALAEQALSEGDLEFLIYELDEEQDDGWLPDLPLWSDEDDEEGEDLEDDWEV